MKHGLVHILFFLAILLVNLGGCAALRERPEAKEPPEVRLEKVLLERALACERKGQSQKALQLYEAALAVIADKKKGLEESLRQDAEKHYQSGLEYYEQGKYSEARREFLVALRLRPDFPEVVELLKPVPPPPLGHYVVHEVREGEYLSAIAENYYGDKHKFEIIARANDLEDATKLHAGMKLIIPETKEVTFSDLQKKQSSGPSSQEGTTYVATLKGDQTSGVNSPLASEQEVDYDPVAIYQEQGVTLLEEGQYLAALHEFQKVLNTDPSRKKIQEYMAWAHYRQGEVFFNQAEYLKARDHFYQALSYDGGWTACKEYIKRAEDAYKEVHYLKGIEYFEEERLKEAIAQWQLVSELDPNYKQVHNYLGRAQTLFEKVQELKEVP
ncbi:MAG: tetratricopeptide repeat protein [Deltaproteobacteria bacterium]|jgi:tetratricopeptide (TPR) repeat protein